MTPFPVSSWFCWVLVLLLASGCSSHRSSEAAAAPGAAAGGGAGPTASGGTFSAASAGFSSTGQAGAAAQVGGTGSGGAGSAGAPSVTVHGGLPDKWWTKLNGERELGPREYHKTLKDITALIPTLAAQGYRILNPSAWGIHVTTLPTGPQYYGFPDVVDYYHIDPQLGTDADWLELTAQAHAAGMAVNCWFQLSVLSLDSAPGAAAVADVKAHGWQQANLPADSPARWALLGIDGTANIDSKNQDWWPMPGTDPTVYYAWHYSRGNFSTNFSDPGWRAEALKILRYWVERGVDGFVFDDPSTMLYVNETNFREIVDGVHKDYPNVSIGGELGCCADNVAAGFTTLNAARPEGANDVSLAILGRPNDIQGFARSRDASESGGLVAWTGLSLTDFSADPGHKKGLLEVATIAGIGMIVRHAITIPDTPAVGYQYGDFGTWPDEDGPALAKIFNTVNANAALFPTALRRSVPSPNGFVLERTAAKDAPTRVLALFNFDANEKTISMDLSGLGLSVPQKPKDLMGGPSPAPISTTSYSVTLQTYGYAFYEVSWDGVTPWQRD